MPPPIVSGSQVGKLLTAGDIDKVVDYVLDTLGALIKNEDNREEADVAKDILASVSKVSNYVRPLCVQYMLIQACF